MAKRELFSWAPNVMMFPQVGTVYCIKFIVYLSGALAVMIETSNATINWYFYFTLDLMLRGTVGTGFYSHGGELLCYAYIIKFGSDYDLRLKRTGG